MVLNKFKKSTDKAKKKGKGKEELETSSGRISDAEETSPAPASPFRNLKHAFADGPCEKPQTPNSAPEEEEEEEGEEKVTLHLTVLCSAETICAYNPRDMAGYDEDLTFLSFEKGQIIDVVEQDQSGWWEGILDGEWGIFPANYVRIIEVYELPEDEESAEPVTTLKAEEKPPLSPKPEILVQQHLKATQEQPEKIEKTEKNVDKLLDEIITEYTIADIHTKPPAPTPLSEDEEEEEIEIDCDYLDDSNEENNEEIEFPESDFVFGESKPMPKLDVIQKAATENVQQMDELLMKHEKTAKQLDTFLKGESSQKTSQELENAQMEISTLRAKLVTTESKLAHERQQLDHLTKRCKQLNEKLQKARQIQKSSSSEESSKVEKDLSDLRSHCDSLTMKLQSANQEIKQLTEASKLSKVNSDQVTLLSNKVKQLQADVENYNKLVEEKDSKIFQLETINSSLVLKIQTIGKPQAQDGGSNEKVQELEQKLAEMTLHKDILAEQLAEKAKNEAKLTEKIEQLQKQLESRNSPRGAIRGAPNRGAPSRGSPARGARGAPQRARGAPPRGMPRGAPQRGSPALRGTQRPPANPVGEAGATGQPIRTGASRRVSATRPANRPKPANIPTPQSPVLESS